MKNQLTQINFIFYNLNFTPYQRSGLNKFDILTKVVTAVTPSQLKNKAYLIDRHHGRPSEGSRELFMNHAVFIPKQKRIICSLALLRSGRTPMIKPHEDYKLVPFNKAQGSIAEVTHFFIDYSTSRIILCAEYNYHGPRISDIEYYLRAVAKEESLSTSTNTEIFLERDLESVINNLKKLLSFEIKIQPKKIAEIDKTLKNKYFTGISSFSNLVNPNYIKLEALYQSPGNPEINHLINGNGKNMMLSLLKSFKSKQTNPDVFENFVIKYEDEEGKEELFNLLKGKKEILKEIDIELLRKNRDWYNLIESDLTEFVDSL